MYNPQMFLSCDWGTSVFRLRLVSIPQLTIIRETTHQQGIAGTHTRWKESGLPEVDRISFYQEILNAAINTLQQQTGKVLQGMPLVIAGMASSSIGMVELPYTPLPCRADGSQLHLHHIGKSAQFHHDMYIISGLRSTSDVMRGEETQVAGSYQTDTDDQLIILPGTHSKHITVRQGIITHFSTYITGELFHLLSNHSILASSITMSSLNEDENAVWFTKGLMESKVMNPLHALFLVRTNNLFAVCTKQENYMYLSGLCIGLELSDLSKNPPGTITLVSGDQLRSLYEVALRTLLQKPIIKYVAADVAVINGHYTLLKRVVK